MLNIGLLASLTIVLGAADNVAIYDAGTQENVVYVYKRELRKESAGDRVLFLDADGKTIRKEPSGPALLYLDADSATSISIRPSANGIRLAVLDGGTLRRSSTGKALQYYRHPEISADASSAALYRVHGQERLSAQQLIAVLYFLKPGVFKLSDEEVAAKKKEMEENEKAEDAVVATRLIGGFDVVSTNFGERSGSASVLGKGAYYYMGYEFKSGKKWQGIGVPHKGAEGDEIWAAFSEDGAAGLAIYEISATGLDGVWYPSSLLVDGKETLGVEKLAGKTSGKEFKGGFKITEATAPKTGDAYKGSMQMRRFFGEDRLMETYQLTWTIGKAKVYGVGMVVKGAPGSGKKYLMAAASSTGECLVARHFPNPSGGGVHLEFAANGKKIASNVFSGYVRNFKK